jgi:hypothetical protein
MRFSSLSPADFRTALDTLAQLGLISLRQDVASSNDNNCRVGLLVQAADLEKAFAQTPFFLRLLT